LTSAVARILLVDCPNAAPALARDNAFGPFDVVSCSGLAAAAARLADERFDGLVVAGGNDDLQRLLVWPALSLAVSDAAVVALASELDAATALALVQRGVQDVLPPKPADRLARALRLALERMQAQRQARKAYATDLTTGLPNQTQLIEHVNQLLALREREPAPMALVVLRIEGLATTEARLGRESANVLRRKIAVRLRAGVRASDVVASLGDDSYAVLLSKFVDPQDADRVAAKLVGSLHRPFSLSGSDVAIAVAAGVARSPADGRDATALLRRGQGLAVSAPATGRGGFANRIESGASAAANDEEGLDE